MKNTASHARKWHRTSPCPNCGTRKPSIEPYARIIGTTAHYVWIAKCRGCPYASWLKTPDDSIKTAIRVWNRIVNKRQEKSE